MNFVEVISGPLSTKEGDTGHNFKFQLQEYDKTPKDLNGASVGLLIANKDELIFERNATISDSSQGLIDFSFNGDEQLPTDVYDLEFLVTYSDSTTETFPDSEYLKIKIVRSLSTRINSYSVSTDLSKLMSETEIAKNNADAATTNANNAADSTKLIWKNPIPTYADLPASPVLGDAYQVENDTTTSNNGTWRWDGAAWVKIHSVQAYDTRIGTLETDLSEQDSTTQTLIHGQNIINSDQSSPLKVEFYGDSKVNQMGREGGFHKQGKWGANLVIDTTAYKFGTSSGKIDNSSGTGVKASKSDHKMYLSGKYVLIGVWVKSVSGTPTINVHLSGRNADGAWGGTTHTLSKTISSNWTFYYLKADLTGSTLDHWVFQNEAKTYGTTDDVIYFDGQFAYIVDSTTFNEIGVSLTDDDVERMFPYVDSVKGVQNPVLKVEGANLSDTFTSGKWSLHSNVTVDSSNKITLNADGADRNASTLTVKVAKNTDYTLSVTHNRHILVNATEDGTDFSGGYTTSQTVTFNTGSYDSINVVLADANKVAGTYTFENPMLNLGTTDKPFVERNPSYLYMSDVTLYGNSVEKDILYRNYDLNRWEVNRWFNQDEFDGLEGWTVSDKTGKKYLYAPIENRVKNEHTLVKYDGTILKNFTDYTAFGNDTDSGSISTYTDTTDNFYIGLPDTETGWLEAWTNTELTNDWIKSYFNGWKYNGDGTTHSWESLVDGSAPSTNDLAYVSANQAPSFENYFLLYQLQDSVVENIDHLVEGSLSISGDSQISVSEGTIVREEVTPALNTGTSLGDVYRINHTSYTSSLLNYRVNKIIKIYKNGQDDTSFWVIDSNDAYGKEKAYCLDENYDTNATYTVTYEILDKYDFTTNLNDVQATYSTSMKSSFDRTVEKLSDVATEVSIHDRQILDMMIRLDALEGGA